MATIPSYNVRTNTSVEVLNAIRNSASQNYQNLVPIATPNAESIKAIGATLMYYPALQNEYLFFLQNMINYRIIVRKSYLNPWSIFKRGIMDMGETIEEIFVELAKPFQYDPEVAESELYKRVKPDVRTAYHTVNYQKFYKATIEDEQLSNAFLSWQAQADFASYLIETMYQGLEYDEYQVMKYLVARNILDGKMHVTTIPAVTTANMKTIVAKIKSISNDFIFKKNKYNLARVRTKADKGEQYMIVNTDFDAEMDVEVLASAFNISRAEFSGRRVLVDGFGSLDTERLAELFKDDPTYKPITESESEALNAIPALLIDKDWFMIYDKLLKMDDEKNAQGLYRNYFLHVWKIFSTSPFANNTLFVPATPTVVSVAISPTTLTTGKGTTAYFTPTVVTTNFASKGVIWSVNSVLSTISQQGILIIGAGETATSLTVTATSIFDDTKKGTATVTVA